MQAVQVSVEKMNNIECRLTILVPAEQVEEAYSKQIKNFARHAKIDGFRPGKVPLNYITQRFGDDARREALNDIIQKTLLDAITEQKLQPISTPQVEPKVLLPNQPLEYTASFEVLPEMTEVKCNLSHIEKLVVDIQPADVDRVIDQLQKQYATWQPIERAAKEKDRVVIDYYAIYNGQSDIENKVNDFPLELGSKKMIPGFEEGLLGSKVGEERTLQLNFPTEFAIKEKAGQPVEFVVHIKEIYEADMPTMDSDLISKLGVKSGQEEDLRKQIQDSLEQERNRLVKEKLKEQVFSQLLEQNPLEIPKALIAKEAKHIHDEMYPEHHDHHNHSEDELTTFNGIAKKRVTLGLLIAEYAKQADIKPDPQKVQARIQEIANVYEDPQEVIDWLSSKERRSGIEAQVIEDQILDKLLENIPLTEKTMTYAELKGIRI